MRRYTRDELLFLLGLALVSMLFGVLVHLLP